MSIIVTADCGFSGQIVGKTQGYILALEMIEVNLLKNNLLIPIINIHQLNLLNDKRGEA